MNSSRTSLLNNNLDMKSYKKCREMLKEGHQSFIKKIIPQKIAERIVSLTFSATTSSGLTKVFLKV